MANSRFTLSWDSFGHNLSSGFSALQQNGEFVDMTLAADGHTVKVHQAVVALGSPYIKQIIANANCPHPVVFLNNVSFKTLRAILEYLYTGETQISNDEIKDFVEAGKNLHVKGIQDMSWESLTLSTVDIESQTPRTNKTITRVQAHEYRDSDIPEDANEPEIHLQKSEDINLDGNDTDASHDRHYVDEDQNMTVIDQRTPDLVRKTMHIPQSDNITMKLGIGEDKSHTPSVIYTLSALGSVHLILNRYEYYVDRHSNNKIKTWRCVDSTKLKCKAKVKTDNGVVVKRCGVHNHGFHDRRILKKQKSGKVFFTLQDAEGHSKPIASVKKKQVSDASE